MEIKIVNRSKHPLPEYKTKASAGMDIRANLEEIVTLKPLERKLIPTGLSNYPRDMKHKSVPVAGWL